MNKDNLKQYLGQCAHWIVPPRLQSLAICAWRHIQRSLVTDSEIASMVKRNTRFKNIHAGEDVFILCCGPSTKNYDLLKLKDKKSIALSYFSLHKHYREIAPDYHLLAPAHPPLDFEHDEKIFNTFKNNECTNTTFFLGHMNYSYSYFNFFKQRPELKPDKLEYICYDGSLSLNDYNYNSPAIWDISGRPFMMRGGLYGALQLAAYMGFKRIYLLGADHDYLDSVNQVTNHFYESKKGYDDSAENASMMLEDVFDRLYTVFHHYRLMKKYLNARNIEVINLSKESKLDMFEKQDFDSLFQ